MSESSPDDADGPTSSSPQPNEGGQRRDSPPEIKGVVEPVSRDRVRRAIAFALIWILAGTILIGMGLLACQRLLGLETADVRAIVEIFFPSLVTLVGTVMGFYFGTEQRDDS